MPDLASLESCLARLEAAGLKATPQRLAILQALWQGHDHDHDHDHAPHDFPTGHLSAEDVHLSLRATHPTLSLGTVYRTLETFVEVGLLRRLPGALDGPMRFDADTRPHHHLVDPDRGLLHDLHDPELDALLTDYFTRKPIPGFTLRQLQLTLIGRADAPPLTDSSIPSH